MKSQIGFFAVFAVAVFAGQAVGTITTVIENPSFEADGRIHWEGPPPSGWAKTNHTKFGCYVRNEDWFTDGRYSMNIYSYTIKDYTIGDYESVHQMLNLSGVTDIIFDARLSMHGGPLSSFERFSAFLLIDDTVVWTRNETGVYLDQVIDVSGLSGIHKLEVRNAAMATGFVDESHWTQWDNFRVIPEPATLLLLGLGGLVLSRRKMRAKLRLAAIVAFSMAAANLASAELIQGIPIDFVTIGNPGNPGDTRDAANPTGSGAVPYEYRIGKHEVTNVQWYDFVAAAGAPTGDPSTAYDNSPHWHRDHQPTSNVSWYEAAQFCNYLTSGDKSRGAYRFSGDNSNPGDFEGIDRLSAVATYGIVYVIPTEDEWYKAAYYTGSGYSTFANGTDTPPIAGVDTNYQSRIAQPWDLGNGTQEQNGTFDIMGNVLEWNETKIAGSGRGLRGGSFNFYDTPLSSSHRNYYTPDYEFNFIGLRVAEIPEPATLVLLIFGASMLRKRSFN